MLFVLFYFRVTFDRILYFLLEYILSNGERCFVKFLGGLIEKIQSKGKAAMTCFFSLYLICYFRIAEN